MNEEFGFKSPLWMARAVIDGASPYLLKLAVNDLMVAAWNSEYNCMDIEEIFERLIQVSKLGEYHPSTEQDATIDDVVDQFREEIDEELGEDADPE